MHIKKNPDKGAARSSLLAAAFPARRLFPIHMRAGKVRRTACAPGLCRNLRTAASNSGWPRARWPGRARRARQLLRRGQPRRQRPGTIPRRRDDADARQGGAGRGGSRRACASRSPRARGPRRSAPAANATASVPPASAAAATRPDHDNLRLFDRSWCARVGQGSGGRCGCLCN
jgi:hypothetical protein